MASVFIAAGVAGSISRIHTTVVISPEEVPIAIKIAGTIEYRITVFGSTNQSFAVADDQRSRSEI